MCGRQLIVVCVILFAFAAFWVKITQRVTTQIVPMSRLVSQKLGSDEDTGIGIRSRAEQSVASGGSAGAT